ncbi:MULTISPECIES: tol-pal system protein YbgF [Alcanivorax]|uniref:tol-pal system protein YbgF n=1 Tax=Alcanivorax TaxID=59753 RepID=UPI001F0D0BE0|nr:MULTISPECIES: tol-pal system protein YbgF [Alcanivorax]
MITAQAQTGPLSVEDRGGSRSGARTVTAEPAGGDDGVIMLMQQMQQYEEQLQDLQGQIERLRHEVDRLKAAERERYLDLDTRINALVENTAPAPADEDATGEDGQGEGPADPQADRQAYNDAQRKLLERDFEGAVSALEAYLEEYPNGSYRPQAHFWLGESYSNLKSPRLTQAREQFSKVVDDYPDHDRAPTSLYKLASLQARGGSTVQARDTLKRLLKQYPDSSEAELAKAMLKQLGN